MELTIIISVYNGERTIVRTLDSVKGAYDNQDVKVIVINDASTDGTLTILEEYKKEFENLKIINFEENVRPGIARNTAIDLIDTEYFMVLDADDEVRKDIFSELDNYKNEGYDIIKFNHMFSKEGNLIFEKEPTYKIGEKLNEEIEVLATDNYYSWGRVFRTDFIKKNNIKFSEKIYYEDINFVIGAYTLANKAMVIPNILLQVNIEADSATRQVFEDDFHIQSLNRAIIETFENNNFKNSKIKSKVWRSLAKKGLVYLENKCPEEMLEKSSEELFKTLFIYASEIEHDYISDGYGKIDLIVNGQAKTYSDLENYDNQIIKIDKKDESTVLRRRGINSKSFQKKIQAQYGIDTNYAYVKYFEENYEENRNITLFMGFDFDFKGNSKYKFLDELSKENSHIFYATKDKRIPKNLRIEPYSLEYYYVLAHAKKVYLETYTDLKFTVGSNTKIIQMWHGTPIKKLLLDSNEKQFIKNNGTHKKAKLINIEKYDEFYVYNEFEKRKLQSAFNLKENQIVEEKSPRIEYLKKNTRNTDELKVKYNIPLNKKVIAYVPTWKDYSFAHKNLNYGLQKGFFKKLRDENSEEIYSTLYEIMKEQFAETNDIELYLKKNIIVENKLRDVPPIEVLRELEDSYYELFNYKFINDCGYKNGDYFVILKSHDFKKDDRIKDFVNINLSNVETQDLIICSDICISDYSSIIFDYMEVNKPVYLLWDDYELYQEYRGIYKEIENDFSNIIASSQVELYQLLKSEVIYNKYDKYLNRY